MELYTQDDVELIKTSIDDIVDDIELKKLEIFEPTRKEIMDINKIVLDYIRDKKRKIYGGYAQNKLIINKNPKDAFYDDSDIPDIDCYSPEPIKDLVALCDELYAKGYKYVMSREAQHKETYSVFVNFKNVCDLSYVPRNIYNKIPFIEIDGINYAHSSFIYIDLYRMMTEPYFSSFRWSKIFPRLHKLQKHYPFNKVTKELPNAYDVPKNKEEIIKKINNKIIELIQNQETIIITGQYAYNIFLEESGIMKESKNYKLIPTPFMQFISTDYIKDASTIILELKKNFDKEGKIKFTEFYPFWQFTCYSTVIYYEDVPILHITSHNKRCTPMHKIKLGNNNFIQIGSFDFVLLMNMIAGLRAKVNDLADKYHFHNIMTSHLVEMRNYYLKKNKKTLLDQTLFKSFIPECIGYTIDPARETSLSRDKKAKEGKMVVFKYYPDEKREPPDYKFANTSGNPIQKTINLKITKYVENPKLLNELEQKQTIKEEFEDSENNSEEARAVRRFNDINFI